MMTPRERFQKRLRGEKVDKIPNLSILMQYAAQHAGIPYGQFTTSSEAMVEAQVKAASDFGLDILTVMSDPYRETSAYGAIVVPQEDDLPLCKSRVITDIKNWQSQLHPFDPVTSHRTGLSIHAIEIYKAQYADQYMIAGWVEGALAEFCDLAGVSEGMTMLMDNAEESLKCLNFITDQAIHYANAQLDAGADIIGIGDSVASLIGIKMYRKFAKPFETRIIEAVHKRNGKAKLHICGDINHMLPDMIETGADIIDVDYMVDFKQAIQLAKGKCSISGNIDPTGIILQGNPEIIAANVRACAALADETTLISSGCEVPKNTPYENLKAIDDTLKAMKS